MNKANVDHRIRILDRAIVDNPDDATLLVKKARCYSEKEDYAQAVRLLEAATKIDSHYAQASFELGIAYSRLKNYDSAIREWEKMVDADGDLNLDAVDYSRYQAIGGALERWAEYRKVREENIFTYYNLGIAAMVLGRTKDALRAFDEVSKVNTSFEKCQYYRARILRRENRTSEAITALTRFLESRPRDPHANYQLGLCLMEEGRTNQAINCFKKVFVDRPEHTKSHLQMAAAYANLMQFDEAIEHLERALKVNSNSPEAHYQMGQCLEKKYHMDEACQAYERALAARPDFKDAHFSLGLLQRTLAQHEKALFHLNRTVELDPEESEAYYYKGIVLSDLKRYDEALNPLREATQKSPDNAFAHYTLGKACMGCGHLEEAIGCFRRALDINPRDVKARTAMGQAFFELNELTRAKRQFEKVIESNPKEAEAHYFLGACEFRLHDYGRAIAAYQKAAQVNPKSALYHFTQGAFYSYNRRYDEAIQWFMHASEIRPENEADLGMFATLQLLATVGIEHAQTGIELQKFAKERDQLFMRFVLALAQFLDARDPYTRYHSRRVASIGTLLARDGLQNMVRTGKLDRTYVLPKNKLEGIWVGGLLHDIGKIGIRDNVLLKKGKLEDDEYEKIKMHPVIGFEGLQGVDFPWPEVLPIVRHHHEKWNGHGYPDGKARDDIPFEAQIIGVADFYDALTTHRPYRPAFSADKAMRIMIEESGKFFNPLLVDAFASILDTVMLLPEAPIDETGEYDFAPYEEAFDNLRISWGFGVPAAT